MLIGAATCSFLLLHAIPGDTAQALAGPQATLTDVENLRKAMHLDAPLTEQYLTYMNNLLHGNLGHSYRTNKPVWDIVSRAWPATMQLALTSLLVAVFVGCASGDICRCQAGYHRGYLSDDLCIYRCIHAVLLAGTIIDHTILGQA